MDISNAARALTGLWDPSWEGALMASLTYNAGTGAAQSYRAEVRASGRRVLRLTASGSGTEEQLSMMLVLPPHKKKEHTQARIAPMQGPFWKRFLAEEISEAALRVDDHNGIHQGKRPVAGGFLLMESIIREFPGHREYRLRFEAPVYAEDAVYLEPAASGAVATVGGMAVFRADWRD